MAKNGKEFEKFLREDVGPMVVGPSGVGLMAKDGTAWVGSQIFRSKGDPNSPEEQAYTAGEALLKGIMAKKPQTEIENLSREARIANQFVSTSQSEKQILKNKTKPSVEDLMKPQPGEMDPITGESDWDGRYLTKGQRERLASQPSTSAPTPTKRAGVDLSADTPDWVRRHEAKFGTESAREIEGMRLGVTSILGGDPSASFYDRGTLGPAGYAAGDMPTSAADQWTPEKVIKRGQKLDRDRKAKLPYSDRAGNPLEDPKKALEYVKKYAPETLTPEQKKQLGIYDPNLPYSRRGPGSTGVQSSTELEPAPAPDPAPPPELPPLPPAAESGRAGTFPAPPISVASTISLYGGKPTTLQTPELLRRPTKETSEKPRKTNQIPDLLRAPPKEPKKGEYPSWFMRMQNQPLPASPPVEGLPFDRNKPLETSSSFSGMQTGAMGPSRSEAELSRMMRDAREAPSAVGPSMYPAIPASMAARLADYVPPPEPPSAPAPDPESLSDLELAKMKRDAKESEPSGLSQAISLSKGVGQFAKNLDQAAGRKIKEAGQKVSDIAKQFRTQRDENFRKNIERLEAKGIKVPGFDVGEKGFGQHGNYPAQGSEDFQGKILSRSLVDLPLGPGETIEDRRKEIVQYYKEKMLPSEYAKTWGFASEEPSPELPGRFDMDPIRSKTPVTTQSFNSPQKRSSTTAPQQVAGAISGNQKKQFAQSSPISQDMASRMISVQTPGQVSTQLTGRPLTTQERDRFKFDSGVPASVAASMNKVTPVRTPLGQEPLTQTEKPIGGGKKGEREMASFTKGMSDAEVNAEFEKLFGKENKDLSIEMKKDMIERFRLGELMQQGGGIMGMNPMYEMEIDPDTGELKLNPKKRD